VEARPIRQVVADGQPPRGGCGLRAVLNSTSMAKAKRRLSKRSSGTQTIQEVAKAAGVSVATVSRTLQMPEVVSEGTRQRVHEAISQLGYTPNAQARILRTSRTRLVIALVPDIANSFFSEVIRGMEQVAHQNRYSVLLGDTQNSQAREQAYADMVPARQADGLITFLPHVPRLPAEHSSLLVNACEYVTDKSVSSVYVDNIKAGAVAVNHLITLGHRDIAFITGPRTRRICIDRQHGYEQALREAGLRQNPALLFVGDFSFESGARGVESFIASRQPFTAIFCANDEMAIAAMVTLKAHGLRVPQDVSVVGFDDIRFARYSDPPLTTISQPKNQLGGEAMNMLLEILENPQISPRKRILPTELVIRDSTARRRETGKS
jgi:LacI family transcriptional regulator, repressor for deo operon, udp, cdd, tsx, nupC, and nupG